MSNLELISYKEYPSDQYTKAIATIRIDGKHVVSFAKKLTKTGNEFWSSPSINVNDQGDKVFIPGYMVDSRMEEKEMMDFVRNCSKLPKKAEASVHAKPTSMDEVANDTIPF